MKRTLCLVLTCMLLSFLHPALADSASWPSGRRAPSRRGNCCSVGCSQCGSDQDCPSCSFCRQAMCTAIPAAQPTARPAPQPTWKATPRPTPSPTARPAALPTQRPTATPLASRGDYTTFSVDAQEQKLLNLLNQDRAKNGLPALALDPELSRIARVKSCDMNSNNYFAHVSPTYGNASAMLRSFGYAFQGVGENIAHHANIEKAEAAFMSSTGHRTNILGRQWARVGIGICVDRNGFVYVTQLFVR